MKRNYIESLFVAAISHIRGTVCLHIHIDSITYIPHIWSHSIVSHSTCRTNVRGNWRVVSKNTRRWWIVCIDWIVRALRRIVWLSFSLISSFLLFKSLFFFPPQFLSELLFLPLLLLFLLLQCFLHQFLLFQWLFLLNLLQSSQFLVEFNFLLLKPLL